MKKNQPQIKFASKYILIKG